MSTPETGGRVVIRRAYYLRLHEETGESPEGRETLARLCILQEWIWITDEEAKSAEEIDKEPGTDEEKQERLNEAVSSYVADTLTHPVLATQFWVSDTSFPIEEAGRAVADFNQGLNDLLTQGTKSFADWAGAPFPLDSMAAGITANFVLEGPEKYLRNTSEVFLVIGVMAGLATGNIALAIGCGKALAKDVIKRAVTSAIENMLNPAPTAVTESHDAAGKPIAPADAATSGREVSRPPGKGRISLSDESGEDLAWVIDVLKGVKRVLNEIDTQTPRSTAVTPREILMAEETDGATLLDPPDDPHITGTSGLDPTI